MLLKKGKAKVSNEFTEELHAMRLTREDEIEVMKKKLCSKNKGKKRNKEMKEKWKRVCFNTLLPNDHLTANEENMKPFLMSSLHGN